MSCSIFLFNKKYEILNPFDTRSGEEKKSRDIINCDELLISTWFYTKQVPNAIIILGTCIASDIIYNRQFTLLIWNYKI